MYSSPEETGKVPESVHAVLDDCVKLHPQNVMHIPKMIITPENIKDLLLDSGAVPKEFEEFVVLANAALNRKILLQQQAKVQSLIWVILIIYRAKRREKLLVCFALKRAPYL